jgi:hypothetical protein
LIHSYAYTNCTRVGVSWAEFTRLVETFPDQTLDSRPGVIAGAVIGLLLAIALVAAGAWYLMRKRKANSKLVCYRDMAAAPTLPEATKNQKTKKNTSNRFGPLGRWPGILPLIVCARHPVWYELAQYPAPHFWRRRSPRRPWAAGRTAAADQSTRRSMYVMPWFGGQVRWWANVCHVMSGGQVRWWPMYDMTWSRGQVRWC